MPVPSIVDRAGCRISKWQKGGYVAGHIARSTALKVKGILEISDDHRSLVGLWELVKNA